MTWRSVGTGSTNCVVRLPSPKVTTLWLGRSVHHTTRDESAVVDCASGPRAIRIRPAASVVPFLGVVATDMLPAESTASME